MKTMSMKLPDSLFQRLIKAARLRSQSKSALVREAIETYLANGEPASSGSCLDLASDLIGNLDGPADLSTNPDHLKGFGQS